MSLEGRLPCNPRSTRIYRIAFSLALSSESGVIALSIPYPLSGPPPELTAPVPIAYSFTFKEPSDALVEALKWASDKHPVDIDIQHDLINGDQGWEAIEELIGKVVASPASEENPAPKPNLKPIVLCTSPGLGTYKYKLINPLFVANLLPPPGALAVPTVKLLAHPMYLAYQARIASLSFSQNVYLKYLPPDWNTPTPTSPLPGAQPADPEGSIRDLDSEAKKEWKRRAKMYRACPPNYR